MVQRIQKSVVHSQFKVKSRLKSFLALKMKLLFAIACVLISGVLSAPQGDRDDGFQNNQNNQNNAITIVRYFYDHNGLDGYKFTLVLNSLSRFGS